MCLYFINVNKSLLYGHYPKILVPEMNVNSSYKLFYQHLGLQENNV